MTHPYFSIGMPVSGFIGDRNAFSFMAGLAAIFVIFHLPQFQNKNG